MKRPLEIFGFLIALAALIIALLTWLAPFDPIGPSPFSQREIPSAATSLTSTPIASTTVVVTPAAPTLTPTTDIIVSPSEPGFLSESYTSSELTVKSLILRTIPQTNDSARLDLFFDAVVEPSTGGPFGQLFPYLPEIGSLVTARVGAQVSSGTQLLHVTLLVDCRQISQPYTTNQVLLEIRRNESGPLLWAATLEYARTWCE